MSQSASREPLRQHETDDRFVAWPLCIALGTPLLLGLIFAFVPPLVVLLIPPMVVVDGVAILLAAAMGIRHLRAHKWRRAISMMVLPIYVALIFFAPVPVRSIIGTPFLVGVWTHLLVDYNRYEAELAAMPRGEPRFRVFDWGGFAGTNLFMIYDESDDLALPLQQWRHVDQGVCDGGAIHIVGHYYLC